MKYLLVFWCLLLWNSIQIFAQISLVLAPTNPVHFSSSDIWNLTVTSTHEQPLLVRFEGVIFDKNSKPIVTMQSEPVELLFGTQTLNASLVPISSRLYNNTEVERFEILSQKLPPGNYKYCVQIICQNTVCNRVIGLERIIKECNTVEIVQPTPLLLAYPEDDSKIKTKRPNFTWIAPMPIGSDLSLTYKMKLVELQEMQTPEDGIMRNRALYEQQNIKGTTLAFPQELADLKEGGQYAWQVHAYLGKSFVASSEVWNFTIDKESQTVEPMSYIRLNKSTTSVYTAVNELKFIYSEPTSKGTLNVVFRNQSGKDVTPKGVVYETKFGDNRFSLNLAELGFVPNETYTMIIQSPTGEQYSLRFNYIFQFKK